MKRRVKCMLSLLLVLCMVLIFPVVPAQAAGAGTKDAPWDISEAAGTDNVKAWLEGSEQEGYTLYVAGEGRMTATFRTIDPPWKSVKSNITAVEIGEGVVNVGAYAFNFCRGLTSVSLPESLTEIGTYAFHSTGVKRLVIPAAVNTIGRMIANPTTYYEVLGSPSTVNNHAFSTSLVSVVDQVAAEALNPQTDVLAIIVLNGGIYGETDSDLANLSYGLIAPKKEGFTFEGWYQSADFTGLRCAQDDRGRTVVNINHIYYAKWEETVVTPTPSPSPEATPSPEPTDIVTPSPEATPSPEPTDTITPSPEATPSPEPTDIVTPSPETTPSPEPTDTITPSPEATPSPEPTDTVTPSPEVSPDPGIPNIKDKSDKKGWDIIKEEIQKAKKGNTVTVEMNGATLLESSVLDVMKGKDITVVFHMNHDLIWSIDGTSITEKAAKDIDLRVELHTENIPENIIDEVAKEGDTTQLSLFYNGNFGFTANLSINIGKRNQGRDAVLYYYNEISQKMEWQGEDRVESEGWTTFPFTHASDYVIVLSKAQEPEPTPDAPSPVPTKEVTPTPELTKGGEPTSETTPSAAPTNSAKPTTGLEDQDSDAEPTPTSADIKDSEPTPAPEISPEPTPEATLSPEPTPTKEPSVTEEPPAATKEPEAPTSTTAPQTPTQSAPASSTPKNEEDSGFNWGIPVGVIAVCAAAFGIVLVRRKSGGKK